MPDNTPKPEIVRIPWTDVVPRAGQYGDVFIGLDTPADLQPFVIAAQPIMDAVPAADAFYGSADIDTDAVRQALNDYHNGIQRYLNLFGMTATSLDTDVQPDFVVG